MSKIYRSREGDVDAIDTKTQLATMGSETAPGPLLVPSSARKIVGIITAAISDLAAAADCVHFIRLEGPGLQNGPEVLAIGADGAQIVTGGMVARKAEKIDIDIEVVPNQEILIFGETGGEDMGQTTMGVTLIFEI